MRRVLFLFIFLVSLIPLIAEVPIVSIYDEFDDGLYGRSVNRGIIISLKRGTFRRSETLTASIEGFLTAVVVSKNTAEKLFRGGYPLVKKGEDKRYFYESDGLFFSFSLEKASGSLIDMVDTFYGGDDLWHDQLIKYYSENYVIRIFSAENVFESWNDEIRYNEALVMATLIGDDDQWLWGIHDGSDILNRGY